VRRRVKAEPVNCEVGQSNNIVSFKGSAIDLTMVSNDAIRDGSAISPDQLRLMKLIFDELCEDHNLTRGIQGKRDTLALAIVEASRVSFDEAVLKTAGSQAIITS